MPRFEDLTGKPYGRLRVLSRAENKGKHVSWRCRCVCGAETVVRAFALKCGGVQSCGCHQLKRAIEVNTKHGKYRTAEYRVWIGMVQRCTNPKHKMYALYGGRNIVVCEAWRRSFEAFLSDMGKRPSPKYSLDRVDTNGHYEPSNCRWATQKEQCRNTRRNKIIEYDGAMMTLVEWSELLDINYGTLQARLRLGWSVERAFTESVRSHKRETVS